MNMQNQRPQTSDAPRSDQADKRDADVKTHQISRRVRDLATDRQMKPCDIETRGGGGFRE